MKCAKKYHNLNGGGGHHSGHHHGGRAKYSKASLNKYISSSVDLLVMNNNKSGDCCFNQVNSVVRYSPFKPQKIMFRSFSLPNINFNCPVVSLSKPECSKEESKPQQQQHFVDKSNATPHSSSSSSSYASTNSSLDSSNSYPNFSLITSSSSASSLSNEVDFFNQFKEILKRSHRSSIAKHRRLNGYNVRSFSSNCPPTATESNYIQVNDNSNQRSLTTTGVRLEPVHSSLTQDNPGSASTPATSAFSNNSIHIDLGMKEKKLDDSFVIY